ncbi:type VI immunity family protein [Chromobacterium violaceum]|uniref:type VI immunity family protein n=1 Tax=Chromobacterium violaceum TaxID=536 RepID=UPI001B33C1B7|nr:type VI immunity family protein [Chromobacterium violaceum]MBP4046411.1 DUF3396 domain-containing protein [Chromobacterium violaceum]
MEQTSMPRQLQRLQQYQGDLTGTMGSDDTVVIRPGLIATFFYEGGSTVAVRHKIVECFDYFYELFGAQLKGKFFSGEKFGQMTTAIYQRCRTKALELVDPDDALEWLITSEKTKDYAPSYQMGCLTIQRVHEEWGRKSFLKFALPAEILLSANGREQYQRLVAFIADKLNPVHGYGGFSPILPADYHQYMPYEYELAQRFIGLDVDTRAFVAGAFELQHHIKGANWLTILGDGFVQQLGGESAIRAQLAAWPEITFSHYAGGLMIQAGEYPDLGAPEDGAPIPYVAVNRVVKPVRTTEPGSLHYYLPQQNGFDEAESDSWYARFDNIPLPKPEPTTEQAAPSGRCDAGQPCPQSGFWWTPAKQDAARYFEQGEVMPDFPSSKYGATIWYLDTV